jgi:hypothetical protein
MAADRSVDLLALMRGQQSTIGIRVIRVVTTEPAPYSFVFEGDRIAVDLALFELPVSMYLLRKGDRMLVYPMISTDAPQRWAVIEKINGGLTMAIMASANTLNVPGIDKTYGADELIIPPFIVRDNAQGHDTRDPHEYYKTGDLTQLEAGDLVSLAPTIVNGAIKYVVLNWHGKG